MIKPTEDLRWHRAKRCGTNACVEVAKIGDQYLVRDSKRPAMTPMQFTAEEWAAFTTGVRDGDFDF